MSEKKAPKIRLYKYAAEINLSSENLIEFLRNKGYEIKSHQSTLTEEMINEINAFFKKDIEKEIKSNEALRNSVNDFLEIGFIRNELVHKNFATYPLDKTAKDIYNLYKSAIQFVDYLKKRLSS